MITKDKIAELRLRASELDLPWSKVSFTDGGIGIYTGECYNPVLESDTLSKDTAKFIIDAINVLPELLEVYEMYEDLCQ